MKSTHAGDKLEVFDQLACCLGKRPVSAYAYILVLCLAISGILAADYYREGHFASSTVRALIGAGVGILFVGYFVVRLLVKKETRSWLFDVDPNLEEKKVSAFTKWSIRILPLFCVVVLLRVWEVWR